MSAFTANMPSPKGANSRQLFALFEDDIVSYIYAASSASLHMRLSIVRPLRGRELTYTYIQQIYG